MVLTLAAAVVLAGGSPLLDPLPWDGKAVRLYRDEQARVTFPVPLTGALLESRHFAQATPGTQLRHRLELSGRDGEAVEVALFDNPKGLPLDEFIAGSLAFLRTNEHAEMEWTATKKKLRARLFDLPRTDQQFAQRVIVFAAQGRVVMVSCRNLADPFASRAFNIITSELEVLR